MSTIHIPQSFIPDALKGNIDTDIDTFKCMLISAAGVAAYSAATFDKRSDFTAYEVSGTGYTAGGQAVTSIVPTAGANTTLVITPAVWTGSTTITAGGAVVYKSRGGADTADEVVCVADFGGDVSSTGGTYTVSAITLQFTGF